MGYTPCVKHAESAWYWTFHLDYFAITGYDHCAAALLYTLEYATSLELAKKKDNKNCEVWLTTTKIDLSNALTGLFSDRSCFDALNKLELLGFVSIRGQDEMWASKQYCLRSDRVSEAIKEWDNSIDSAKDRAQYNHFPVGNISYGTENSTQEIFPTVVQPWQETVPTTRGKYFPHNKEEYISSNTSTEIQDDLPSEGQNQTPTTEAIQVVEETPLVPAPRAEEYYSEQSTSGYDLQLSEPVLTFVANAYRQSRPAKITKAELKRCADKLESMEVSVGPEEFRTSLWIFLNTSTDTLRKGKWPIWYFIKFPPTVASEPAMQSPRHVPTRTSSESPANAPEPFTETNSDPSKNPLTYIEQWNTIVYESPVDVDAVPSFTMANLKKAINGGDFQKCFERVCEKCQRMNSNKPDTVTFDGLFMGFVPMWQEIYAGKHDWKMGKEDAMSRAIAAAEREERGGV